MKKVLEAELLSIAHRILQMKNKEDIHNLYQESKELYEKLLILKFHEDNFNLIQPHIAIEEIENKLEKTYQEAVTVRSQMPADLMEEEYPMVIEADLESHKIQEENLIQDQAVKIEEPLIDQIQEKVSVSYADAVVEEPFKEQIEKSEVVHYLEAVDSDDLEEAEEEEIQEGEIQEEEIQEEEIQEEEIQEEEIQEGHNRNDLEQILNQHLINKDGLGSDEQAVGTIESTLEDSFFGIDYHDVDFIRVEDIDKEEVQKQELVFEPLVGRNIFEGELPVSEMFGGNSGQDGIKDKKKSINDAFASHITVSLNDRIAFEKNLFNGSSEDFNRVLSQLNTFNSLDQAVAFIEDLVKPDYNYWTGKEEYVGRLMDLIEKRFA